MIIAASTTPAFGAIGVGGVALALATFLVLGVRGEGKVKLRAQPAMYWAFIAATAFAAAGHIWANPDQIVRQGLTGLGTGGNGPFGNVGMAGWALLLLVLMLTLPLTPARGAILGLIAGIVWPAAGDGTVWAVPTELAAGLLMMVGG